jgi:hypothetical protein
MSKENEAVQKQDRTTWDLNDPDSLKNEKPPGLVRMLARFREAPFGPFLTSVHERPPFCCSICFCSFVPRPTLKTVFGICTQPSTKWFLLVGDQNTTSRKAHQTFL